MKVKDLYKQLQILIDSGQEDLPVMISTRDTYQPLELVDIDDGKCMLCDSWTPNWEDNAVVHSITEEERQEIIQKLREEGYPVRADSDFQYRP